VTSAAGAVGLVIGQIDKNKGRRVIGVTSSREKADRRAS
jgi:NADPH-dependent curcumin reductase CurA